MTKTEYLEQICKNMGVDVSAFPDKLLTTYLSAISEKLGVMKDSGTLGEFLEAFKGGNAEGGGATEPAGIIALDGRTSLTHWYNYLNTCYVEDIDTHELTVYPVEELPYPSGTQNVTSLRNFFTILTYDNSSAFWMENPLPAKRMTGTLDVSNVKDFSYAFSSRFVEDLGTIIGSTTKGNDFSHMFYESKIKEVPFVLDLRAATFSGNVFEGCSNLQTAPQIILREGASINYMFRGCSSLTKLPDLEYEKVDSMSYAFGVCSFADVIFDTHSARYCSGLFGSCSKLKTADLTAKFSTGLDSVFSYCTNLESVTLRVSDTIAQSWSSTFSGCKALVNLTIAEGKISKSGLNLSSSTLLTHDSLMSVINALADVSTSTSTYKLTLGSTNLAKLTDDEKLIAEQKGWTLA